jgi:NAD(P)H-hydrate epimerase
MKQITEIPKLKPRPAEGHKGTFGKVLLIGGSVGMTGAIAIAGKSTLKSGAGLVRVATSDVCLPIVAGADLCYTTIPLPCDKSGKISGKAVHTIMKNIPDNDCVAFGCGAGQSMGLKTITENLISSENIKLVVDGDGLNNLSKIRNFHIDNKNVVLTPHPGEMKRLWKASFRLPMPDDRKQQAVELARKSGAVIVLKGANTVVTDGEKFYINKTGNPGMGTGGSGDCLTGMIAGLAGQELGMFDAAVLGVYLHGAAGDLAAERFGQVSLTAMDIVNILPDIFKNHI